MLSLEPLDKNGMSALDGWIPRELIGPLQQFAPETNFAWVAKADNNRVGLLWMTDYSCENKNIAQILLLKVALGYRRQGIGTALLRLAEQKAHHCKSVNMYLKKNDDFDRVTGMLKKMNWQYDIHGCLYETTVELFFSKLKWAKRERRFPYQGYIFPWKDLTDDERRELKAEDGPDSWKADNVSPFYFDAKYEPHTSLGLRANGKVIGWIINQTLEPDNILFGSYFVRKKYRGLGLSVGLLLESLRRQRETEIPRCTWYVQAPNGKAKEFYAKLLGPCIVKEEEWWLAMKTLKPERQQGDCENIFLPASRLNCGGWP